MKSHFLLLAQISICLSQRWHGFHSGFALLLIVPVCKGFSYQLTFRQKDNMLLILLPSLGSINWISLWKYWQIFSYTNQNNIDRYPFHSHMWHQEKKESLTFYLYLRFGLLYGQDQSALIVLYAYTLMCIDHEEDGLACFANLPTGLNTDDQKQAMAFTASKLYQCQKFVEKQHRVIPAKFFQMLYLGHSCYNSSCKDQCCSHYSSNVIESFISAALSRHCLLPLPVV